MEKTAAMWIRTNEHEEAMGALEAFGGFLARVRQDSFEWRWAILSLHTALQGFMEGAVESGQRAAEQIIRSGA
jgi:hypothetical protein